VIVGVSDEGMGTLEKWVEAKGVTYPIVNAPKALSTYGVGAYPTVYVVDAKGDAAARGNPAEPQLVQHLQAVTWQPSFGATPLLKALNGLWNDGKFVEVDKRLRQAEADANASDDDRLGAEKVRGLMQKLEERLRQEIAAAEAGPDYVAAEERLRTIDKQWSGLPLGQAAKDARAKLLQDKRIRGELDAGRKLRELLVRLGDEPKKLTPALQALIKRFPDTFAAGQARELLKGR